MSEDPARPASALTACVLTVSDRCHAGVQADRSGPLLQQYLESTGWRVTACEVVPDEHDTIARWLVSTVDVGRPNLVLTTGGTGAALRDTTPEATAMVIERPFPGIAEMLRAASGRHTKFGVLSRGTAGSRGRTLIINLPGHPRAVAQLWPELEPILDHACRLLAGEDDPHS